MMAAWDALIEKSDLRKVEIRAAADPETLALGDGEVLLAVESFSMSANNVTYGAIGDAFGYWKFFPAPDGLGRIPVWGFATVLKSNASDVAPGLRLFGYLPMSTHFKMQLVKTRHGYLDTAAHRAELPPTYNSYSPAPADPADDYRALLRPLLMTSFLLDDFLSEDASLKTLVLTSASSKTAMGLAWFARRHGVRVVGLTSPANLESLRTFGLYDQLLPYDRAGDLASDGAAALVDFAGNSAVIGAVHTALGAQLSRSLIVGGTHWEAPRLGGELVGPKPVLFFAPDQIRKRSAEWGPEVVTAKFDQGLADFIAANPWLTLVQHTGSEGLLSAYRAVVEGHARPQDGHIIRP